MGSEHTLELATWNIRNFPSDEGTPADLAALLGDLDLEFGSVLHPSPASPLANKGWEPQAEKQLAELGVEF